MKKTETNIIASAKKSYTINQNALKKRTKNKNQAKNKSK